MFFSEAFNIFCYASGFYMLLFLREIFMMHVCVCVCVCVCCVCVCVWCVCVCVCVCCFIGIVLSVHLSMRNMEKRDRNIIIITKSSSWERQVMFVTNFV